ncbi:MAG: ACP S-malonyltransferase [Gammaproteobacteria bacterium]|nr:ACP S-malonyltransferase [Gammaproteobacteria bacterium]
MDTGMLVFPGQGAQYAGMGSDLHESYDAARSVYDEAGEAVGYDIRELSFSDPEGKIGLTRYTQPALLTHSIACLRVTEAQLGGELTPMAAAGHSLGEYSALVAGGALSFRDALLLVSERGRLMGEHGEGGMLALAMAADEARQLADRHCCQIAGLNLPTQTVVGGTHADLEQLAADLAENYPRKRGTPLATEGAFHTYLMVTAAREFREVLKRTEFLAPRFPVLSNYTARPHDPAPDAIRTRLFFQLINPVNWVGCMQWAVENGASSFLELGGGIGRGDTPAEKRPNLQGILRKYCRGAGHDAEISAVINAADADELS